MERVLFVPMMLEALPVGQNSCRFADMEPNFWQMDLVPLGVNITNSLFTSKELPAGIHLHWTFPDALLHGKASDGKLCFPPLPDRYILHRLWAQEGTVKRRSWLIKSNFCTNENGKTSEGMTRQTLPVFLFKDGLWQGGGKNGHRYAFAGGVADLDPIVEEEGFFLDEVTAVGMGDPLFSAFYLKSKTIFGFYDSCSDAAEGPFTYCVAGYYDRPEQDPFHEYDEEKVKELQWKWTETSGQPGRMICHGMLQSVPWKGPNYPYASGVPADDPEIYIGNNSNEAMAAYLKNTMVKKDGSERLLHAMQSDLLMQAEDPANPDSLIELEENLHQQQFESINGGSRWLIREDDRKKEEGKTKSVKLPEDIGGLLEDINNCQAEYDRIRFELEDLKEEGYGYWCKYLYHHTPSPFDGQAEEDGYLTGIRGILKDTGENRNTLEDLSKSIAAKKEEIETNLKDSGYRLIQEETRFCAPAAPAVLIPGAGRAKKQGFQKDENGELPCRMQPVSGLLVTIDGEETEIAGKEVLEWTCPPEAGAAEGVEDLLYEALLLSSDFTRELAEAVLKKMGKACNEEQVAALMDEMGQWRKEAGKVKGNLPCNIADRGYEAPWSPLLMQWRILITLNKDRGQEEINNNYTLQEIDYEYLENRGPGTDTVELYGSTLISPHATIQAGYRIKRLADHYGTGGMYSGMYELGEAAADFDILSQQLEGFTEGHLLKEKSLYVPICNYQDVPEELLREMNLYLANTSVVPQKYGKFENFLPIRSGVMELKDLWIVDSFGQIKKADVSKEHIHVSEVMQLEGEEGKAFLRPRFLKPCRMKVEWIPRNEKDPSPVIGYLQPNFLDRNLQMYDEQGAYLGIVQRTKTGTKWLAGKPGNGNEQEGSPHLQGFRESLLKLSPQEYQAFLDALDEGFGHMATVDGGSFRSLCFGKVIALSRLRISLSERGRRLTAEQESGGFSSKGYENTCFPIRVGDTRKARDGLLGFFPGDDPVQMYQGEKLPFKKSGETLSASLHTGSADMTVLMDPTGRITLSSGLLPVVNIQLDAQSYQEQIRNMEVHLNTAPVLSYSDTLAIPVPGSDKEKGGWEFLYQDSDRQWKTLGSPTEPPALLQSKDAEIREGYLQWHF